MKVLFIYFFVNTNNLIGVISPIGVVVRRLAKDPTSKGADNT